MPEDDHEGASPLTQKVQPAFYELGADALPLAIRPHGHWSQTHSDDAAFAFGSHRRKENVSYNIAVIGHQRQDVRARQPQLIDKASFDWTVERELVDLPDRRDVFRSFVTDR
jgi:hypothetical protein